MFRAQGIQGLGDVFFTVHTNFSSNKGTFQAVPCFKAGKSDAVASFILLVGSLPIRGQWDPNMVVSINKGTLV